MRCKRWKNKDNSEGLRTLFKNIKGHEATINQESGHIIKFQNKGGYKTLLKIMNKTKRQLRNVKLEFFMSSTSLCVSLSI